MEKFKSYKNCFKIRINKEKKYKKKITIKNNKY